MDVGPELTIPVDSTVALQLLKSLLVIAYRPVIFIFLLKLLNSELPLQLLVPRLELHNALFQLPSKR